MPRNTRHAQHESHQVTDLLPVILSGGTGTRLWPLSREQYPKQLLALFGDLTMLQVTARRLSDSINWPDIRVLTPLVVGNEEYRFITAEQLRQIDLRPRAIILEPVGRNTAPALTLAALAACADGNDPLLVAMPADHIIGDLETFRAAVKSAANHARDGKVVTFGAAATAAETGYGYIRAGDQTLDGASGIAEFVEKPNREAAERYLASGQYYWNSGIFLMKSSVWLAQIRKYRPDIYRACERAFNGSKRDHDFIRVDADAFAQCPADSIDYAVMEKIAEEQADGEPLAVVVPLDASWSDVGAWSALWDIGEKNADGNLLDGDVLAVDTRDSLVMSKGRLVCCVGVSNAIVVETPDAVLVASRDGLQRVKEVVASLKAAGRPESTVHRKVHRPWGYYESINDGSRFQVKRIVVNPGASLSAQMHYHRAEHWIVVKGTAKVTCGEREFLLSENESTYIPLGTTHRLANPGKLPLEIIEVQSGAYLGEDDIVRFHDAYGRDTAGDTQK